jgi:hypothetical protein
MKLPSAKAVGREIEDGPRPWRGESTRWEQMAKDPMSARRDEGLGSADDSSPDRDANGSENGWNGVLPAALRQVWRLIILVVGVTIVAAGVAMIVLPGPAIVVIPAGLALLATEFVWARRLLDRVRKSIDLDRFRERVRKGS